MTYLEVAAVVPLLSQTGVGVVQQQVAQPHKQRASALKDGARDGSHLLGHEHACHVVQQEGEGVGNQDGRDGPARLGVANLHTSPKCYLLQSRYYLVTRNAGAALQASWAACQQSPAAELKASVQEVNGPCYASRGAYLLEQRGETFLCRQRG